LQRGAAHRAGGGVERGPGVLGRRGAARDERDQQRECEDPAHGSSLLRWVGPGSATAGTAEGAVGYPGVRARSRHRLLLDGPGGRRAVWDILQPTLRATSARASRVAPGT